MLERAEEILDEVRNSGMRAHVPYLKGGGTARTSLTLTKHAGCRCRLRLPRVRVYMCVCVRVCACLARDD